MGFFRPLANVAGRLLRASTFALGGVLSAAVASAAVNVRFADVVTLDGAALTALDGVPVERLALFSCQRNHCAPIPFQIDERDTSGAWVLDQGPFPNADVPPGVLDENDVLVFMAADAGEPAAPADLPGGVAGNALAVSDPLDGSTRWAYLLAFPHEASRSPLSYVQYDRSADRLRGARVELGFGAAVPEYLALVDGDAGGTNLLDRLKVRASASFLFGLIRFARDESDLTTEFVGWRQGPIRVIRSQRQWVRLGWRIRSPTFTSYTYFYRDFAQLPVGLRLNFPPTYFFGNIAIRVVLDFRDLSGWSVLVPSLPAPVRIDGSMTVEKERLNQLTDRWFALMGPQITLVQAMDLSPSLQTVRHRLLYVEDAHWSDPPEWVAGAQPGIGYLLDRWDDVGAGAHSLAATSYALPVDLEARQFMTARETPLAVSVMSLSGFISEAQSAPQLACR